MKMNCKITCVHLLSGCDNLSAHNLYRKALHVEQKGGLIGALYRKNEYGIEEIIMANTKIEMIVQYSQGSRSFSNMGEAKFFSQTQLTNYMCRGGELFKLEVI